MLRVAARRAVRLFFFVTIAAVGGINRRFRRRLRTRSEIPRRILLIRLDLLGDVLFSTAGATAMRRTYPGASISMLTLPYTAPLARLHPAIDEVIEIDTNRIRSIPGLVSPGTWKTYWKVYRGLRDRQFDLALSLSGRMASLWAFLSGAPRTIGYRAEAYPNLLTDAPAGGRFHDRIHDVEYVKRLTRVAGAHEDEMRLRIPVPESAREAVAHKLEALGIGRTDRVTVVHAGAVNGSAKRWPAPYWSNFIDALQRRGTRVVMAGARSDTAVASQVISGAATTVASLVGQTTIEELLALVARADLIASGDSGPLHLAVALGRPLVCVYGPTDPAIHGPYRPIAPVRLHRHDLACSPCYSMAGTAECPLGHTMCMWLVPVETMVASAIELLGLDG